MMREFSTGAEPKPPWPPASVADAVSVAARWLLGACFLYAGLTKAADPALFLKLLRQYGLVDHYLLLNAIAALLPWFEALCGLLLLLGVAVRGSALLTLLLLLAFTTALGVRSAALHRTRAIPICAVKFDCGCGTGEVWACRKLASNALLILLSASLLAGRGQQLCARYRG